MNAPLHPDAAFSRATLQSPDGRTGFAWRNGTLHCEGVPVRTLAEQSGTPLYVYSANVIRSRYRALDAALRSYPHTIHYALKANSTLAIVRLLRELGCAVDANSGGEIDVALRAGYSPADIVFTGVGKTPAELEKAVALGVRAINAESAGELERVDAIARRLGTRARVAVRVNPDIDARSHPGISTGLKTNKFGIGLGEAYNALRRCADADALELVGLHVHVGSQMVDLDPIRRAVRHLVELALELKGIGLHVRYLDVGGGLGISYDGSPVPGLAEYGNAVLEAVRGTGLPVMLEPGRSIVGPAGALIGTVVDVKAQPGGSWFVVLDAGMTELMRPALYGAYHRIAAVDSRDEEPQRCDIVGPLCETSDTVGSNRLLALPNVGDLMAVMDAGAYGVVMASNYNRRPMPAEILVDEATPRLIRRRQTIDDLLALES